MFYLVYISAATKLISEGELLDLLIVSREKNARHHITGMLLYGEGLFMQVLEGKERNVRKIYDAIQKDGRHYNVTTIASGFIEKHNFPDWSMAFSSVNGEQLSKIKSYMHPASRQFLADDNGHPAITMMKTFAETNNLLDTPLNL